MACTTLNIFPKAFPGSPCRGSCSEGYCRSGGLNNGAHESRGCSDLNHFSHKGCRLSVGGDFWFIKVGGEECCKIGDGGIQFFCLINGGNRDVFCFWFRGVFGVTSKLKTNSFFWVCCSVKWSPLASVPNSFFSVDSESIFRQGWSIDLKFCYHFAVDKSIPTVMCRNQS